MSDQQNFRWYLAQIKPNCGQIAERNLRRQDFKTFLPMEEQTRRSGGKFVTRKQPLFPGYIFVEFDPTDGVWRAINSTYGIARLVSFGDAPAPVPDGLVAELQARFGGQRSPSSDKQLNPGDKVSIIKGPFSDFVAEVEKTSPDRRVWVLMEIMGSQTRIAVDSDQVRAIKQ